MARVVTVGTTYILTPPHDFMWCSQMESENTRRCREPKRNLDRRNKKQTLSKVVLIGQVKEVLHTNQRSKHLIPMLQAYQWEFHCQVVRSSWLMSGTTWENRDQVCGGSPWTVSLARVETKTW